MPAYKDQKTGTWYCQFYYTDYTGKRKKKMKRGFPLKRDADQWEHDFLEKMQGTPDMTFQTLSELYLDYNRLHRKQITFKTKESRVRVWLVPYFGNMAINEIKPKHILAFQNHLKSSSNYRGEPLSDTYIGILHRELSGMFNFAVRYYELKNNPCRIVGNIEKKYDSSNIQFWTRDQFDQFIETFDSADPFRVAFQTLYWTGMRVGELQALTLADVDFQQNTISINKTYHMIKGKDVIESPKTSTGKRTININQSLADELQRHISRLYQPEPSDRIFTMNPSAYGKHFKSHAESANLPKIRVHDLRHSHASLLIDMGFSPVLIAERLGHKDASVTLSVYAHLYPNKQSELADQLEDIF